MIPNTLFIYQKDDYSCGPACLATVARIYNIDLGYDFFRELLDPCQKVGSDNFLMADVAKKYLPFMTADENVYHGGVAVANILYPKNNEGHYVVFLRQEGENIIYYDPYDHDIHVEAESNIQWTSETRHLEKWSINFERIPNMTWDFWYAFQDKLKEIKPIRT